MKTWLGLIILTLACTACEAPVTSTFVDGTVKGVSIPAANAVSVTDTDILGGTRVTVWLGSALQCSDFNKKPVGTVLYLDASPKVLMDGGHSQLLIVRSGTSLLDTGIGTERIVGTTDRFVLTEKKDDGTLVGRFSSSFAALPDGGGVQPDGGTFSGDFIAPPCGVASAGCEVAPMGTLSVLALALLRLRRSGRRGVERRATFFARVAPVRMDLSMRVAAVVLTLVCSGCEPPITSTFVNGEASGISIPMGRAMSTVDTDILGRERATVWIGTDLQCPELRRPPATFDELNPGPSAKFTEDGGRAPLLILQGNTAYLDLGIGGARTTGGADYERFERTDDGISGRFSASFSRQRDGGGARGTFTGDFVAPPCGVASAGCEVTPVGTFGVIALALLWLRRTRLAR